MGKFNISTIFQIVILVLALICTSINSWPYEFPRILLPLLFQLESVATLFIYLIYVITLFVDIPEDILLLLMMVSLFHGIVFLAASIAMILTFSGDTILGFESDIWDKTEKMMFLVAGGVGAVTSIVLIIEALICLIIYIRGQPKETNA